MGRHIKTGKAYTFHEKHGAWVIYRDFAIHNCTGGSHFESKHFDTEAELVKHLDNEAFDYYCRLCCIEDGKRVEELTQQDLFYLRDEFRTLPEDKAVRDCVHIK